MHTDATHGLPGDYANPYVTHLQRNAALSGNVNSYFSQVDPPLQPLNGPNELPMYPRARFEGGLPDANEAALHIQDHHQQSYEPAPAYPDQQIQPYLQASSGALRHPPSESGFSMARANQRLKTTQAMSSGEPSTAAETLNTTGQARKSMRGS